MQIVTKFLAWAALPLMACSLAVSTEGLSDGAASGSGASSSGAPPGTTSSGSSTSSGGGSTSSSGGHTSSGGSSASGGSTDAGADAAVEIFYATGFEGSECSEWGGTPVGGGVAGNGCRVCASGELRRTFALVPKGTYVLSAKGRATDFDPGGSWIVRVGEDPGPSHENFAEVSAGYALSEANYTPPAAGRTLAATLFLAPSAGCLIVDDVVLRRY